MPKTSGSAAFFPKHNTYIVYVALQPLHRAALPAALEKLPEKNFLLSEPHRGAFSWSKHNQMVGINFHIP